MRLVLAFLLRWIINSFGLWLAASLFGSFDDASGIGIFISAGFLLSIINIFIRPFVLLISLPITILTLGLFTLIVNALMVLLALHFTPGITLSFGGAVIAGILIGLVNYIVNDMMRTQDAKR